MEKLRDAPRTGALLAVSEAEGLLDRAVTRPVDQDLRSRLFALAEALYQSIRAQLQLSVDRYRLGRFWTTMAQWRHSFHG